MAEITEHTRVSHERFVSDFSRCLLTFWLSRFLCNCCLDLHWCVRACVGHRPFDVMSHTCQPIIIIYGYMCISPCTNSNMKNKCNTHVSSRRFSDGHLLAVPYEDLLV